MNRPDLEFEPAASVSMPAVPRRVMSALVSQPWVIRPAMLDLMVSIVDDHAAGVPREWKPTEERKGGVRTVNGVAVIPVQGVLVNRANMFQQMSGAASPQTIRAQFMEAMRAPDISAVMFSMYSPGGQVLGTVELADTVWQERQQNPRPVVAFVDGCACSGCYWLAAQCDEIVATRESMVGSIGVISKIVDETRGEKNSGRDSYVLRTGPNKATGIGPITDDQVQVQREISQRYFSMFTEAVQRGRGITLNDDELSGREYIAETQVGRLIDRVGTFEDVISAYMKKTA